MVNTPSIATGQALRLLQAGWEAQHAHGFLASWMLHGSPGIGKTEIVQKFAKAPILMLIAIYLVEARLLRATPAQRAALVSDAQADSGLDMLRARARAILTKIAARRGLESGCLHLVIEQSDLLRVAPLSLVSVQSEEGPELLALDAQERALIEDTLFAAPLTERALQRIGLARKIEIHDVSFVPAQISAHARMAALMAARSAGE